MLLISRGRGCSRGCGTPTYRCGVKRGERAQRQEALRAGDGRTALEVEQVPCFKQQNTAPSALPQCFLFFLILNFFDTLILNLSI